MKFKSKVDKEEFELYFRMLLLASMKDSKVKIEDWDKYASKEEE